MQISEFIRYYNEERLHSAIGYVAPKVKLEGREKQIFTEREQKLEAAREARKQKLLAEKQQRVPHQKQADRESINSLTQQVCFSISS
jgi:hypothetical protein